MPLVINTKEPNTYELQNELVQDNRLSKYDLDCRSSRSYFNSEKCNFPGGIRSRDIPVASQTNALQTELMEIFTDAKWNIHVENIFINFLGKCRETLFSLYQTNF